MVHCCDDPTEPRKMNTKSLSILEKISKDEPDSRFCIAAKKQIEELNDNTGLLGKLFHT